MGMMHLPEERMAQTEPSVTAITARPVIDKSLPEPFYQQIVRWMVQAIDTGEWPEHYKLPAEPVLARRLNVSRGTLRRAMTDMIVSGRLRQIHGKGTFVAAGGRLEQQLAEGLVSVAEELDQARTPFETAVLEQAMVQPTQRVASLLGLGRGELVFFLKRVRKVRGKPLILFHNYVTTKRCPQIVQTDFTAQRLFDVLEARCGLALDWGSRTFEAQAAGPEAARLLAIGVGDPVLYLEQVVYLREGAPIEMSDVWFRGDSFRLSATVKRQETATLRNGWLEFVADPAADLDA
jgi:GntR family transcriptional regulator